MTYDTGLANQLKTMDPSPPRNAKVVVPEERLVKLADLRNISALGLENLFRSCGNSAVSAIRPHFVQHLLKEVDCSLKLLLMTLSRWL